MSVTWNNFLFYSKSERQRNHTPTALAVICSVCCFHQFWKICSAAGALKRTIKTLRLHNSTTWPALTVWMCVVFSPGWLHNYTSNNNEGYLHPQLILMAVFVTYWTVFHQVSLILHFDGFHNIFAALKRSIFWWSFVQCASLPPDIQFIKWSKDASSLIQLEPESSTQTRREKIKISEWHWHYFQKRHTCPVDLLSFADVISHMWWSPSVC